MALVSSSILKSPKFLCKYVRISPPSTVVCYVHSQLAVQPYDVQRPCIFKFNKEKKTDKRKAPEKEKGHGLLSVYGKVANHKSKCQALKPLRQSKGTFEMYKKQNDASSSSLMTKWNHDPLMDHKQLVLMIFKQDAFSGKPSFDHKENLALLNSIALHEKKKPCKVPAGKLKTRQTCSTTSTSVNKVRKTQDPSYRPQKQLKEQTPCISPLNQSIDNFLLEAAMLFADLNVEKPNGKKVFKSGPDPTQLSSVLLELRERIPEFFQKKPNYALYHKKIKFVNNITGITTHGIYPYRGQVSSLRWLMLHYMTDLSVDILKITKHPNESAIKVRWRIKGIPKIRKLAPYIARRIKVDADGFRYLDGFSVFEVGSDGLIHCHRLHKVMPSSSKEKESPLWMLILLPLINVLYPRHCESFGAYFECSSTDKEIESVATDSDALAC